VTVVNIGPVTVGQAAYVFFGKTVPAAVIRYTCVPARIGLLLALSRLKRGKALTGSAVLLLGQELMKFAARVKTLSFLSNGTARSFIIKTYSSKSRGMSKGDGNGASKMAFLMTALC